MSRRDSRRPAGRAGTGPSGPAGRRPPMVRTIEYHCGACGHHLDDHGDWGECSGCMNMTPPGPCAEGDGES